MPRMMSIQPGEAKNRINNKMNKPAAAPLPTELHRTLAELEEFGKTKWAFTFTKEENQQKFRITSFFGEEKDLLNKFKGLLNTYFNNVQHLLCAHNGKEFDFPYIARRMIIHGIDLPEKLNLF